MCAYKTTLTRSRSRFNRSIHRNNLLSFINGFTNSRCRLLLKELTPAVPSYITIFNCPKSVPTIPPDPPKVQQIQGSQAKGNTLPWQINSIFIISSYPFKSLDFKPFFDICSGLSRRTFTYLYAILRQFGVVICVVTGVFSGAFLTSFRS